MKIAFVGDIHIGNQVRSRIDDYFETCLNKLEQVFSANDIVVFLGDIFNTPAMELFKIQQVYTLFMKYSQVKKYAILGNHDVYNMNCNTLSKTTLGLFQMLECLDIVMEEPIEITTDMKICALPLKYEDVKPNNAIDENTIVLGHHFFNLPVPDSLSPEKLEKYFPKVRFYFFGHDHQSYEPFNDGHITVLRPGSLLRNAATTYNFEKVVGYYRYDTDLEDVSFVSIDYKPANEVFEKESLNRTNYKHMVYLDNLEKVIDSYSKQMNNCSKESLLSVLKELNTPEPCMQYIAEAHKVLGVELN